MASQLYEYAVLLDEKRDKEGNLVEEAKIVVPVTATAARDEDQAQLKAARAIPSDLAEDGDKMERLMVVVRPF